jgi:hypothetical protein
MRLSNSDYQTLGIVLVKHYPEMAAQLMPYTIPSGETDLSQIPSLFKRYCEYMQVDPQKQTGPLFEPGNTKEKMQIRLLFIGTMLYIYNRHIFNLPKGAPKKLRWNFGATLSDCLSIQRSGITRLTDQVISWIHNFPEFRKQIIEIANIIKPPANGQTT